MYVKSVTALNVFSDVWHLVNISSRGVIRFVLLYGMQNFKQLTDKITLVLMNERVVTWPRSH